MDSKGDSGVAWKVEPGSRDGWYQIEYQLHDNGYSCNFRVTRKFSPGLPSEEIEPTIGGHVKWDGCANLEFGENDCLLHFCGKKGLAEFGEVLMRLWDIARRELMAAGHWRAPEE